MESPERVRRVTPPITTMVYTMPAVPASHQPTGRKFGESSEAVSAATSAADRTGSVECRWRICGGAGGRMSAREFEGTRLVDAHHARRRLWEPRRGEEGRLGSVHVHTYSTHKISRVVMGA